MSFLQYFILILGALLGGGFAFFIRKSNFQNHQLFLSFSGAYLFGVIVLHLIPELYIPNGNKIGIYILVGFFIQVLLEQLSHGIEHGHIHIHEGDEHSPTYIYGLLLGLSIHALMEGIPLGNNFTDEKTKNSLLTGISLHKIPEAFALMNIMLHFKIKKMLPLFLLVIFALLSPFSAWVTTEMKLSESVLYTDYISIITAIVIGSFLHITTTILFESGTKTHKFTLLKIFAILLGVGLSILSI